MTGCWSVVRDPFRARSISHRSAIHIPRHASPTGSQMLVHADRLLSRRRPHAVELASPAKPDTAESDRLLLRQESGRRDVLSLG